MKAINLNIRGSFLMAFFGLFIACESDTGYPDEKYRMNLSFSDSSDVHPKAVLYQQVLDNYIKQGAVGLSLAIRDEYGTWLGSGGYADLKSRAEVEPGHCFLIASISKVFTATAFYSYVDEGLIDIDDPVSKWIDPSICNKIENASKARISHLLAHTSGIRDYYTVNLEMDRYNRESNNWTQEDVLEFVYGKKAQFELDEYYGYSNTNYLLLGMILEEVSGLTLQEVYQQRIFDPLHLTSAWYGVAEDKVPANVIKGYRDLYASGQYVEADWLYMDEIGIGGDGGIAINAQDLQYFMTSLLDGGLISQESLEQMTDWFDKPPYWDEEDSYRNGYGLEWFDNEYGVAYGHTGGIDGFSSLAHFYPEKDVTVVALLNFVLATEEAWYALEDFIAGMEGAIFE